MVKNLAGQKIGAQLITAADGTAFSGTVTVRITIDAGTQTLGSVGSGVCTHEGNGYHTYAPSQAETDGDLLAFTFTGTGAVPETVQVMTQPIALTAAGIADALLTRDMSAVIGAAARSPLNALRFLRNKWSLAGTTLTVTTEDDATTAWTATVTTNAGADPISGSDPT